MRDFPRRVLVPFGTRKIDDDLLWLIGGLRVHFVLDSGESTEKEISDVGEDGGAAGGNAVLGEQAEEIREDLVDVRSGVELRELTDENGGEVGLFAAFLARLNVFGAEARGGVRSGVTATAAGAGAVLTARQVIGEAGVGDFLVHFEPRREKSWVCHPGVLQKSAEMVDGKGVVKHSWCKEREERDKE